jgi:hypothetical protein
MGSNILYRFALPEGTGYKLVDNIFKLDTLLQVSGNLPDIRTTRKLILHKLNSGNESWVKTDRSYHLYFWNNQYNWELFGTKVCKEDSVVVFQNVPYNTYYRLTDTKGNEKLERIFTYEHGEQVWW